MKHSAGIAALALAFAVSACNGDDTDTPDAVCTTTVAAFPENNESRAYYRTTVEASFSPAAVDGATITVTDGGGANVAGSSEWDGKRLVFTPAAALTPGGSYTTTITFDCNGETLTPSASWTVSEVGTPVGDLNSLIGNTYSLDLQNARFLQPEGVGALLGSFLTFELFLEVDTISGDDMGVFGALGVEGQPGVQEPCQQTIDFPAADISENPFFQLGPQKFTVNVEDVEVTIEDLFLSGSFAPDGSYIDGAVLAGTVDTRPFKGLVDDNPDAPDDAVCELASSLNVECVDCPDNSGKFCLSILADSIGAEKVATDLEKIEDPCALERCSEEPDCQQ